MSESKSPKGPDLEHGIDERDVVEGRMTLGHVKGEAVLLARRGGAIFAVGATCTHYGGPLAEGILDGETVHCPWHHACFDLRSGEAIAAPALRPIGCWDVERRDGRVRVSTKRPEPPWIPRSRPGGPRSIVLVGGGAAGHACAEMLRRRGYDGRLTMVSADPDAPYDRPNLSKDYLAGSAPEDWIPLRSPEFFREHEIELVLDTKVSSIDVAERRVHVRDGQSYVYDALLLATGATPRRLEVPGADLSHVHVLRTLRDSRAIIAALAGAKHAVLVGAGFIGLEVAASLRARGLEVHVVAPEAEPLEHVMGAEIGRFLRALHESHGVVFHLGDGVAAIARDAVSLKSGATLPADLVVVGVGVTPSIELAARAGLAIDRGIAVDAQLQTSVPGIYAAGDVARWPYPRTGQRIRVEHWVVAERHGQLAARNMLGERVPCTFAPFFWSQHYDVAISFVGYAASWDEVTIDGDLAAHDATATYRVRGKTQAVATIGRDRACLRAELALERQDDRTLVSLGA